MHSIAMFALLILLGGSMIFNIAIAQEENNMEQKTSHG